MHREPRIRSALNRFISPTCLDRNGRLSKNASLKSNQIRFNVQHNVPESIRSGVIAINLLTICKMMSFVYTFYDFIAGLIAIKYVCRTRIIDKESGGISSASGIIDWIWISDESGSCALPSRQDCEVITQRGVRRHLAYPGPLCPLTYIPLWHRSQSPLQLNCLDTSAFLTTVRQSVDLRGALSWDRSAANRPGSHAERGSNAIRSGDDVLYVNHGFVAIRSDIC